MNLMRLTRPLVVLSLAAAFAGCSRHATEPPPPGAGAPRLVASFPAARATGIFYTTDIWGEFDRPLDRRTVNAQSVFLKLDGQRIACAVTYDSTTTHRIVIDPIPDLLLQRTYTVEFSTSIRSAAGVPLDPNVFFQFSTNSLRRVQYDFPAQGSLVGPLSSLGWGGSQVPLNDVFFEVYVGTDSVAVEQRTMPYIQRTVFTRLLPSVAWPRGERVYWAVTAHHATTNERVEGAVRAFEVVDASLPVITRQVPPLDHGSMNATNRTTYCSSAQLPAGPTYNAAIRWNLTARDPVGERLVPDGALVVGARMELTAQPQSSKQFANQRPSLWLAQADWGAACAVVSPGPPYPEGNGLLAEATMVDTAIVAFDTPRLAAFLEARLHNDIYLHGALVRTLVNTFYYSPLETTFPDRVPKLTVQYVLPPSGSVRAATAAGRAVRRQALEKTAQRRSVRLDPSKGRPL